jgi:putative SOS response-associated peptidase YedK
MLAPYAADAMMAIPVSTKVNAASGSGPELILPIRSV